MSITLSLTSKTSEIDVDYFPPIDLDKKYELALLNFECYNSIPNINESNNTFYYDNDKEIKIPVGSYEIDDIYKYLLNEIELKEKNKKFTFKLFCNRQTLKCFIYFTKDINFKKPNNIGSVLGFKDEIIKSSTSAESNATPNIFNVTTIRIICNIASGSYINEKLSHCIFEFCPNVSPGYKISLIPNNLIYFPVIVEKISHLTVTVCDQENNPIDFRGELLALRLHLRPRQ